MKSKLPVLSFLLFTILSWGQASITTLGTPVVENFTGFSSPAAGTAVTAGNSPTNWTISASNNWQGTNQVGGTAGGWYANNNLSYLGSGSASNGNATWRLRNNTGSTITSFDISFVARMWKSGTSSPAISLTYSTNSTGTVPASGALTSILTFNDATANIATGTTLSQTVSSLSIPNGDYIYIRFLHPGGSNSDNFGWDDVSITCNATVCSSTTPVGAISGTTPACGNTNLSFSGTAVGPEIYYWQTSATGTSTANNASLPLNVTATGSYYVRTYNGTCWSASSVGPYAVTINPPVAITTQPANKIVVVGNTGTFSVSATGSSLSYQWQVSTDGGTTWSNIGSNSNSYTTPATTFAMNGYFYQVIISGGAPCVPVVSDAAELFVTTPPCLGSNFDSATTVPAGWSGSSSNDTGATHYSSAPNCRALTSGVDLITSATNNPIGINFNVDASGSGGQVGTLYYRIGAGAWTSIGTFTATTSGSIVSYNLTSSPNLSAMTNVSFRIVSGANTIYIDDLNVYCGSPCTPATISSVTPTSGPVGTEVTITASSGSLTGASATFNGVAATVVSTSATQLVVTVPAGATTGSLIVTDSQPCEATTSFTVITDDNTSCQGATVAFTDLIISEVYDSQSNNVWHMELYNPTATPIDLAAAVYKLERYGTIGDVSPTRTVILSGIVPAGGVFLADLGDTGVPCVKTWDFTSSAQGINALDEIRLTKNNIAVDVVYCPNEIGYTIKRKATAAGPTTTYNAADWDLLSTEDCTDLGLFPASIKNTASITVQPSINLTCSTTAIVVNVTATEGFPGGNALAYQWYVAAPGSASWSALANAGVYSGVTTAALNISSVVGLDNYQYYCQVRENTATCFIASNAIIIKGSSSTTWNGTAWDNGIPSITTAAVINGTYVTATNGNFSCCSLTVNGTRTLTISSSGYVEVQNNVNNSGSIIIQNDGQLIQINETDTNTGTYTGTAFQVNRTVDNLRSLDYVYWSAPTENYAISGINGSLRFYWNTTAANPNGTQGYWLAASGAMNKGQGYIVRGPSSFTTPQTLAVNFTGKPFNGQFTYPITRGSDVGSMNDNLILVGNPYPSAIDADVFLATNPNIEGAVHIWTHGTLPSTAITSPFYQNFAANYTMNDYITYNGTASSIPGVFEGKIASGQGFFIKMNEAGAANQTITFNNAMRGSSGTALLDNSQFFRNSNGNQITEKNRIWLDLINASNKTSTAVVGYVSGATMAKDNFYDAYAKLNSGLCFYSRIANEALHIQGRALPFNAEDKVALGMEIPTSGTHKIAIRYVDGLFTGNQAIYLEDKKMNIIHDLKANPYTFTVDHVGFENDRFVLRFTNATLGNDNFEATANSVVIYTKESIQVSSSLERIKEVEVYDVLGRTITVKKIINSNIVDLTNVRPTQSALIVKVVLENGLVVTKKILF